MIDIKEYRKSRGWTQTRLAEYLGVSKSMVSQVETGRLAMPELWEYRLFPKKYRDVYPLEKPRSDTEALFINKETRMIPVINRFAYASFADQWDQAGWTDDLKRIPTICPDDGNYFWFEIRGDSMAFDGRGSIEDGDLILAKELQKHHWGKLQIHRKKLWVIHHKEHGLLIKEILNQTNEGEITCHSWNPIHEDFVLHLDDVVQLYYFIELRIKNL